jgi:hypothetical protein
MIKLQFAGFEILTAVTMKVTIFWNVTLSGHADVTDITASIFWVDD